MASLLALDLSGAFDRVSHPRLIHILKSLGFPAPLVNWIQSFLRDRQNTLILGTQTGPTFQSQEAGIPQGSPISPILFLLFSRELVEIVNSGTRATGLGYVDDTNILAFGDSTEANCRALEAIHQKCQDWALRHRALFAPEKYELIHLSRNPRRFNMGASLALGPITCSPKPDIRILGVQIDTKLCWAPHIKITQEKALAKLGAITALGQSTWGAYFRTARLVYNSAVRAALTYGAAAWAPYSPIISGPAPKSAKPPSWIGTPLDKIQKKALQHTLGAFKATPEPTLELEAGVPPLQAYIHRIQATTQARNQASGAADLIRQQCLRITGELPRTRAPSATIKALLASKEALRKNWNIGLILRPIKPKPPWTTPELEALEHPAAPPVPNPQGKSLPQAKKEAKALTISYWKAYRRIEPYPDKENSSKEPGPF